MAKKILVGFDGSPWARSAAKMAGWLASRTGAKVLLLRAITPREGGMDHDDASPPLIAEFKEALASVDAEVAALRRIEVQAEGITRVGEPVRLLMRAIEDKEPALVTVGTFGHRPVENWLLGSVADKMARSAPVPVLLMPRPDYAWPPSGQRLRVLVPVEGEVPARASISAIEGLGVDLPTDLTLLEVMEDVQVLDRGEGAPRRLSRPGRHVVEYARARHYDVIALVRHGPGRNPQMLLDEVAETIVRQSPVPVLVGPPLDLATRTSDLRLHALAV